MPTALESQLRQIAVAGTQSQAKAKASLLFSKYEANDLDKDSLFAIGRNGLAELIERDQRFEGFEATLFSESVKNIDVTLQTKQDKARLDQSIALFLRQLSPYALETSAFKVLEWLLRRFRAYQFNVHDMVACMLPYHETTQFVQVVSLLVLKDDSHWGFLKSVQKSKIPLDRATLVERFNADPALMNVMCEMVLATVEANITNKPLWTFFTCTVAHYISATSEPNEDAIRVLLACVLKALSIQLHPELQAAMYMLLGQLCSSAQLQPEVIADILDKITLRAAGPLEPLALMAILTVCQSQRAEKIPSLPPNALSRIVQFRDLEKSIAEMAVSFDVEPFLRPFVLGLVSSCSDPNSDNTTHHNLLANLVQTESFPNALVSTICNTTIDAFLETKSTDAKSVVADRMGKLLNILQLRHPQELDRAIEDRLKNTSRKGNKGKKMHRALYEFISSTFKGTLHEPLADANTTLFMSLQHSSASVRLMAVDRLKEILATTSEDQSQATDVTTLSIEDVILGKLKDDSEQVLMSVLSMDNLASHVPNKSALASALVALVTLKDGGADVRKQALRVLVDLVKREESVRDYRHVKSCVLSCFLLTKQQRHVCEEAFTIASKADFPYFNLTKQCATIKQHLEKLNKMPKGDAKNDQIVEEMISSTRSVVSAFAEHANDQGKSISLDDWMNFLDNSLTNVRLLSILVLSTVLAASKSKAVKLSVATAFVNRIGISMNRLWNSTNTALAQADMESAEVLRNIVAAKAAATNDVDDLERSLLILAMRTAVQHVPVPERSIAWLSDSARAQNEYKQFLVRTFETFATAPQTSIMQAPIKELFSLHLKGDSAMEFLAKFWTDDVVHSSAILQSRSLQIANALIDVCGDNGAKKTDFQLLIPSLIVALQSQSKIVRHGALVCLKSMKKCYRGCLANPGKITIFAYDKFYGPTSDKVQYLTCEDAARLIDSVLESKDELLADATYISTLFAKVLGSSAKKGGDGHSVEWKKTVLLFLASNILAFNKIHARIRLLIALNHVDSPMLLRSLHAFIESTASNVLVAGDRATATSEDDDGEDGLLKLLDLLLGLFTAKTCAKLFESKNDKYIKTFLGLLNPEVESKNSSVVQLHALNIVKPEWFARLPLNSQFQIFGSLISLASDSNASVAIKAKEILHGIPLTAAMITNQLHVFGMAIQETGERASKRSKTSVAAKGEIQASAFHNLSALMELLASKPAMSDKREMIPTLFELLGVVISMKADGVPVSLEYIKQLILASLVDCINEVKESGISMEESQLRPDFVVQCIRATDNPQTHNASLLLMAALGAVFPEVILLHIMPVFTFMGANVLRQDDNYSFHVIRQTLETLVPVLVNKHRESAESKSKLIAEVKPIVKVFVNALFHIPKHRRLRLFSALITTLGEADFLDVVVAMLLMKSTDTDSASLTDVNESVIDFSMSVMHQFNPATQVKALLALLQLVDSLPNEVNEETEVVESLALFDASEFTSVHVKKFKYCSVNFFVRCLSNKTFIAKSRKLETKQTGQLGVESVLEKTDSVHVEMVKYILKSMLDTKKYQKTVNDELSEVYCEEMTKKLRNALNSVHRLLSLSGFLNGMVALINHTDDQIRLNCLTLLKEKVADLVDVKNEHMPLFVSIVSNLKSILEIKVAQDANQMNVTYESQQMALECLATMAQVMGKLDVDRYAELIPVITAENVVQSANQNVVVSSMSCITSFTQTLGPRMIPYLPKFVPLLIGIWEKTLDSTVLAVSQNVALSVVETLTTIVDTLPHFISTYIPRFLLCCLHPQSVMNAAVTVGSKKVVEKSKAFTDTIARKVPSRILVPVAFKHFKTASHLGHQSLVGLFDLIANAVKQMTRTDLEELQKDVFKFYITAFDYRRKQQVPLNKAEKEASKTASEDEINTVEQGMIDSFLQFVMKLNETWFKPLFLKTLDWATSEVLADKVGKAGIRCRLHFFYKLLDNMLNRLKSIFVPFCGYILDNSIILLTEYASGEETPDDLWALVIGVLHKCFLYDNDGLINADRFHKIMKPLVNQIGMSDVHGDEYMDRMKKYVIPCIGQLAVNVNSDALWKPLNQAVLHMSRKETSEIRLTSLYILQEFFARIGEEFLVLLPETIPFLAELLEDNDEEVEKLCQIVCNDIQQYLGEPLQQYFNM
ncbi:HEAT repeat-containing protein 1 [Quaeritorhiza haematococci]|nr:HEAT repeat-containing protein 1 [Quaeritorhiza haematococci]